MFGPRSLPDLTPLSRTLPSLSLPPLPQPLLQFIIFPVQFAYLYSYGPTGSLKGLPEALAAKWKEEHKITSQEAFAEVKANEGKQMKTGESFFQTEERELAKVFDFQ